MTMGMGLCSAPGIAFTAEAANDFLLLDLEAGSSRAATLDSAAVSLAWTTLRAVCLGPFFLLFSAPCALSAVTAFFFFRSARAIASASHAALTFPRDAGRLLVPSADPASPAICAIVRPVRTEVSYESMSNPATTSSSFFLISSHSFPLLPGRRALMCTSAKSPLSRFPFRRNFRSPFASIAAASFAVPGHYPPLFAPAHTGSLWPPPQPSTFRPHYLHP